MSELKPCPFCGSEATVERIGKSGYFYVACNTAYCCDFGRFDTEAEAIAAWNTRVDYHGYEQAAIEAWESIKAWNSRAERTCKQEERGWGTEGDHARVWLTCGHDCMVPTVQDLPNYCPTCGARVVGRDDE